jgi:UDPglucose 6-dehydrogenase
MRVAVVGTGYVGLVTGTCLAETGNQVICVDIDEKKVAMMQDGQVPIYEPGLELLFERNIKYNRISFTVDLVAAVEASDIIFLALPTPPGEDGSADLSYVLGVANQLGKIITSYKVIVDKSTVPVGTAEKVRAAIALHAKVDFDVVSNPEFLREGYAVEDFMKPERVVVGASSAKACSLMEELYKPFVRQGNPIIFMDERSAELTKYAANSFLATKITFMNEIANICELVGANVDMVRVGMGSDSRIGKRFLFPGIGYGGSCFPKDVQALYKSADDAGYKFNILDAVMEVNERQKTILLPRILKFFKDNLQGVRIAVWGLAFKPNTDDIREAPSLYIIDELLKAGAQVIAFDPEAMGNVKGIIGDRIDYAQNEYEAVSSADALVICTEWQEFRTPDFARLASLLTQKVIFDGRNLYEKEDVAAHGLTYHSIGRP